MASCDSGQYSISGYNFRIVVPVPPQKRILNTEQRQAVRFGKGPLLIIAGAGTGKTTVITERIAYLIEKKKARPEEILALTFTQKASREMEERVDLLVPYGATQMWILTFHGFCDRVLKAEALILGLNPGYTLVTESESIQLVQNHIFQFPLSTLRPLGNPTKFVEGMITHFSRLKDEDISQAQYETWAKKQVKNASTPEECEQAEQYLELAHAMKTYEEIKLKENVLDFSDLVEKTLCLLRNHPSVLAKYQRQFKYVLVDEYQDTNFAQNELAMLLARPENNLNVCGDDDQSIYKWRGAAISNIIQFRTQFPKAKIVVLTKNYRSVQSVLDSSYRLIQHNNPDRLEVAENIDKRLECMRRIRGEPIRYVYEDRVEDEAEEVAKTILALTRGELGTYEPKDIAILVRANSHAEPFVRSMLRRGVPYQFLGPGQLFKQPEVKDLIAYLLFLSDVSDSISLYRIMTMEQFTIPSRDIALLLSWSKRSGKSLYETVESAVHAYVHTPKQTQIEKEDHDGQRIEENGLSLDGNESLQRLFTLISGHLAKIRTDTAGQILYDFLVESGLMKSFTSVSTKKEQSQADNIAKFFDKIKSYEATHSEAGVFAVSEWIQLAMNLGESPTASDMDWTANNAVNILTVHSAKGLEFPVVFVVNLVSARFPTTQKREQLPIPDALIRELLPVGDAHLEEERRLMYVAMTRARDRLYLTAANYYGEGKREKKLSPFLAEALGDEIHNTPAHPREQDPQLRLLDFAKPKEADVISEEKKRSITYISYSQFETFHTCPLQYKYRYIMRVPVMQTPALLFGDTIHRTIRLFYEDFRVKKPVSKELLLEYYGQQFPSGKYRHRAYEQSLFDHGKELLEGYYEKTFDPTVHVLALEQPFKIHMKQSLFMGGKIDRVDQLPDGTIEIIDYKTGTAPKRRDATSDFQLSVYTLAASDPSLYGKNANDIRVSLYFFEGQQKVTATRTKEQADEVKEEVKKIAESIEKSTFEPTPGRYCDFCEFRMICDAWK